MTILFFLRSEFLISRNLDPSEKKNSVICCHFLPVISLVALSQLIPRFAHMTAYSNCRCPVRACVSGISKWSLASDTHDWVGRSRRSWRFPAFGSSWQVEVVEAGDFRRRVMRPRRLGRRERSLTRSACWGALQGGLAGHRCEPSCSLEPSAAEIVVT